MRSYLKMNGGEGKKQFGILPEGSQSYKEYADELWEKVNRIHDELLFLGQSQDKMSHITQNAYVDAVNAAVDLLSALREFK